MTAKDGDKAAAQEIRGLTVGNETGCSTRLAARPGESTTRVQQDAGQEPTRDKINRPRQQVI